jgi:hypothetical protein
MMKRIVLISIITVALSAGMGYAQMMEGGMMGHHEEGAEMSQQSHPCQMGGGMMGGYGMGQGMMGGYGMGHGMMGGCGKMGGYGMGPGMMGGYGMGHGMMGGCGMGQGMMGGYGMGHGMMGGCGMMGGHGMGQGMMGGYGMGHGMMGGCAHDEEQQNFLDETADLRKELHGKKFDYFEAIRKSDTKPETISRLIVEIRDLQKKIYEKAQK